MRRAYATAAASSTPSSASSSVCATPKPPPLVSSLSSGRGSTAIASRRGPPPPLGSASPFATRPTEYTCSAPPPLSSAATSSSHPTSVHATAGPARSSSSASSPSTRSLPPTSSSPHAHDTLPQPATSERTSTSSLAASVVRPAATSSRAEDKATHTSSVGPASGRPAKVGQPLPTCLRAFLPSKDASRPTPSSPVVARLPPPPPRAQVKLLSDLLGLLPHSDWRQHVLIARTYHQIDSALLTPATHQKVAAVISDAPLGSKARSRLTKVIERLRQEDVEVPKHVQERFIRQSVRCTERPSVVEHTGSTAVKAWNLLYGDVVPLEDPAIKPWNSHLSLRSAMAARRPTSYPTQAAVREMIRSPTTTNASFQSMLAFSPSPSQHLGPLIALHARQYTLISNLPALLQDPNSEIDAEAINQIMHAFAMDEKLDLEIAIEAYAAFRRHAAGLHWRRVYLERAAKGLYQSYDDATVSFANPILDSLGYSFPSHVKPNRHTYSLLLRACIVRGNLNLALVIFKDMLSPNGMSLRIPGSATGPRHAPPVILETFLPGLQDYVALFAGFHQHGETEGLLPEECHTYDEALAVLMPPQEGGGIESSQHRIWRQQVRKETTRIWDRSMNAGWEETELLEDPTKPKFEGELTSRNQYAINVATENKRWSLKTLVIVFRSFLSLLPSGEIPAPNPLPAFLPPTPPRFLPATSTAPHPRRIYWILQAFCLTTNYNPAVLRGAWDALENKFGEGNEEGWVGWRVGRETEGLMRAVGVGEGVRASVGEGGRADTAEERRQAQVEGVREEDE